MSFEFETVILENVAELKGGFAFKSKDYTDSGRFVLRTVNITDCGRITCNGATYISEEKAKEYERFELREFDTLFVMVGATLGKVGLVKYEDLPALLNQNMWVIRANPEKVNPRYLHYAFTLESRSLLGWASGAARDFVRRDDFRKMKLSLPTRKNQDDIASFLASIDDKIELNTQTNQTLEQIAQAIFKSWFVDFEPVKAKMAVLEAGGTAEQAELAAMSAISAKDEAALKQLQAEQPDAYTELAQTAALFPSAMEESELGEIPEGWEVAAISEFGKVVCGKTPSKKKHEYYGDDVPFIKIPDMHGNVFATSTSELLSTHGAASQPKKTIPKGSVCVSCIATVGQVVIASKESHTNQQINSIVPAKESYTPYLYFSMKMKYKLLHDLASGGSATLNLNTGNFSKIKILLPKESVLNAYQQYALPLLTTIYENVCQNHTLSDTRDTLLPKLLTGGLPITNTEVAP